MYMMAYIYIIIIYIIYIYTQADNIKFSVRDKNCIFATKYNHVEK